MFQQIRGARGESRAAGGMLVLTGAAVAISARFVPWPPFVMKPLVVFSLVSLAIGVINLLPVPPLDGSKVVQFFLPERAAAWYLNHGDWAFFALMGAWFGGFVFSGYDLIGHILEMSAIPLFEFVAGF